MKYEPIQIKKTYEIVADSIIDMIKNGDLHPGDRLDSIQKLAKRFGVSQSAVREALSGLRVMGLVEMRQGEGTYVKTYDPTHFSLPVSTAFLMKREDVRELYELRKILEVGAARLAAECRNEQDLRLMKEAINEMAIAKKKGEMGETADLKFHMIIASATRNKLLINLMNNVTDIMRETITETRRLLLHAEDRATILLKEHKLIYEAIEQQKPELAAMHMYDHLADVETTLFKYLDR